MSHSNVLNSPDLLCFLIALQTTFGGAVFRAWYSHSSSNAVPLVDGHSAMLLTQILVTPLSFPPIPWYSY
jgi:hypothetical protein